MHVLLLNHTFNPELTIGMADHSSNSASYASSTIQRHGPEQMSNRFPHFRTSGHFHPFEHAVSTSPPEEVSQITSYDLLHYHLSSNELLDSFIILWENPSESLQPRLRYKFGSEPTTSFHARRDPIAGIDGIIK